MGIQQTCVSSAAPSVPLGRPGLWHQPLRHLPGGRREAVVTPRLLAALTERLVAALPRCTWREWLASPG